MDPNHKLKIIKGVKKPESKKAHSQAMQENLCSPRKMFFIFMVSNQKGPDSSRKAEKLASQNQKPAISDRGFYL